MVNILFSTLKIIGMLLAFILLVLLSLLLIVLLGPVSYRVQGEYEEDRFLSAGISWLGFVLRCHLSWTDRGLQWTARLFGIPIASNEPAFLAKKEQKQHKTEQKRQKKKRRRAEEPVEETESESREAEEPVEEAETESRETEEPVEEAESESREAEEPVEEAESESREAEEPVEEAETEQDAEKTVTPESEPNPRPEETGAFISARECIHCLTEKILSVPSMIGKRWKALRTKFRTWMQSVWTKTQAGLRAIKEGIHKAAVYQEFFLGEKNRPGFAHIWFHLKKMLFHILPQKLQGEITFGMEDPYTMGQLLTVLAFFYPIYGDKFKISPDFEKTGFSGYFFLRGRMIPGYLLFRLLSIISKKDVRRIIKEGRKQLGGKGL